MTVSLSFVLPVRNAEQTIARQVHHLLDVLSELTERFEILVMDEGSTDHTPDVARDLQRQFPQVRVADRGPEGNPVTALDHCLAQAAGELVLVEGDCGSAPPSTLRGVWAERGGSRRDANRSATAAGVARAADSAAAGKARVVFRLDGSAAGASESSKPAKSVALVTKLNSGRRHPVAVHSR